MRQTSAAQLFFFFLNWIKKFLITHLLLKLIRPVWLNLQVYPELEHMNVVHMWLRNSICFVFSVTQPRNRDTASHDEELIERK